MIILNRQRPTDVTGSLIMDKTQPGKQYEVQKWIINQKKATVQKSVMISSKIVCPAVSMNQCAACSECHVIAAAGWDRDLTCHNVHHKFMRHKPIPTLKKPVNRSDRLFS